MLHERTNLLKEWDESRNFPLTPDTVSYGSKKKVRWTCENGHSWHPSLNGALTPEMVTRGVTPSSTKFAPLPSCDKTNSIKTIKAAESDVLSAALLFA